MAMQTSKEELEGVIRVEELDRFRNLGLGRGVDATNPNMWTNKSSFIVRHISPTISNLIGTEEGGIRQYFTEEVSSLKNLQMGIKLSLNEPSSQVKVGINADHSRSISSTNKTVGIKVRTRSVSFRENFDQIPIYSLGDTEELESLESQTPQSPLTLGATQVSSVSVESFESQLYRRILDRIHANSGNSHAISTEDEVPNKIKFKGDTPMERLSSYLAGLEHQSREMKSILTYCSEFVEDVGINHYVNTIELGAMTYESFTMQEYDSKFGIGGNVGVSSYIEAAVSAKYEKKNSRTFTNIREIGKVPKDRHNNLKRDSSEESVIRFHIQPIHKLVQLQYIRVALHKAVKDYLDRKSDQSEGPFLISGVVGDTHVYWRVNKQYRLVGTTDIQKASPFYVIPVEDKHHCEFSVTYYKEGKNAREQPRNLHDPTIKQYQQAPLPRYLTSNANMFGSSRQPLQFTSSASAENTHFCLQQRIIQRTFCSSVAPVSPKNWIEGEEFYINCSRRSFKIDGYLAMKGHLQSDEGTVRPSATQLKPALADSTVTPVDSIYATVIVPTISYSDEENLGMLFRLLPVEFRKLPTGNTGSEQIAMMVMEGATVKPRPPSTQSGYLSRNDEIFECIFGSD